MLKILLTALIIFVLSISFAQETSEPEDAQPPQQKEGGFSMVGGLGTITMDGETYTQLIFRPELKFWKFGIGLDISLLINSDGDIYDEEWDEWEDYVKKIYYIRYGEKYRDFFYGRIGGFPQFTLGRGLIMSDYTNMLEYPSKRQIGLNIALSPSTLAKGEIFTSDITKNELLAARVISIPLSKMELPLISNLILGVSAATDRDQFGAVPDDDDDDIPDVFDAFPQDGARWADTDDDGWADFYMHGNDQIWEDIDADGDNQIDSTFIDNSFFYVDLNGDTIYYQGSDDDIIYENPFSIKGKSDPITIVGADVSLPIYQSQFLTITTYSEVAQIIDHKMGFIFPGFQFDFMIFRTLLEYRIFQEDFQANYFNMLYDSQRAIVSGDSIITKESTLSGIPSANGWYGEIRATLGNIFFARLAYEDMRGDNYKNGKTFYGKAGISNGLIPKLNELSVAYSQIHVEKIFSDFKNPNSMIEGRLGYDMGGSTVLYLIYQERYRYNVEGKIEPIKTMNFSIQMRF